MAKRREEQAERAKQIELCRADISFLKQIIQMAKGVGICFRPRSTYNSFVLIEAGRVALFCLDFFETFFIKQESLNVK
jgi:hypothetical protein